MSVRNWHRRSFKRNKHFVNQLSTKEAFAIKGSTKKKGTNMSEQENINIVKQTYEHFLRGDIESLLKLYGDNIVWEVYGPDTVPTTGLRKGLAQVAEFFAVVNKSLEVKSFEPQEFIAQGNQVVVLGHYNWTAKPTGRPFAANWAHIVTLSSGKIIRFREYTDTAAAVEAFAGSAMAQKAGK
jgi:uncharacterized protein